MSAGRELNEAKSAVEHGEWLPMLKEIGINARGAQRLMSIGSNGALSNASSSSHLPKALDALYELSRMDPDDIEDGIQNGRITPDMTIRDAERYARPAAPDNVDTTTGEILDNEPTTLHNRRSPTTCRACRRLA